jgi:response regulator NasT
MTAPASPLRIAVADDERDTREFLQELLERLGYQAVAVAENGQSLVEQCRTTRPDLVITDIKMPDMDGLEASEAVNRDRQVPVILVSAHHDAEFLRRAGADYIMAYLVKPVKPADLVAAIALAVLRFEHFQRLQAEAVSLRQALEDRKVIERAKGILMKRSKLDEPEAFRRLQHLADVKGRKLVDIAQIILTAEEAFRPPAPG